MTTLTITTPKGTRHLINVQGGVIESTTDRNQARKFKTKSEAIQFTKDNNILQWRAMEHE